MMEALLGHAEEAVHLARNGVEMLPESRDAYDGANLRLVLAQIYAWTGDKERALAELTHLLQSASAGNGVHGLRTNLWFMPLHSDPKFEALLNDPKNNAALF